MTIQFSCECGARFEVPDDKAGLDGRCRQCGVRMVIPHKTEIPLEPISERPDDARESDSVPQPAVAPATRFCPFCGSPMAEASGPCPRCGKTAVTSPKRAVERLPLTTLDWILVTALAPAGMVAGMVSLIAGNRKGLDMIGISTAAMMLWWVLYLVVGWIG